MSDTAPASFACLDCDYSLTRDMPRCPECGAKLDEDAARVGERREEIVRSIGRSTSRLLLGLAAGFVLNTGLLALFVPQALLAEVIVVLVLIAVSFLPGRLLGLTFRPGLRPVYSAIWARGLLTLHGPWIFQPSVITVSAGFGIAVGGRGMADNVLGLTLLGLLQVGVLVWLLIRWSTRWFDLTRSVRLGGTLGADMAILAAFAFLFISAAIGAAGGAILAASLTQFP